MKRSMLITLILFIGILLVVMFLALQHPVRMVKYKDGMIIEVNTDKK